MMSKAFQTLQRQEAVQSNSISLKELLHYQSSKMFHQKSKVKHDYSNCLITCSITFSALSERRRKIETGDEMFSKTRKTVLSYNPQCAAEPLEVEKNTFSILKNSAYYLCFGKHRNLQYLQL